MGVTFTPEGKESSEDVEDDDEDEDEDEEVEEVAEKEEERGEVAVEELELLSVEKMEAAATATRLPLPDRVPNRLSVFRVALVPPVSVDPPLVLVLALIARDPSRWRPNLSSSSPFASARNLFQSQMSKSIEVVMRGRPLLFDSAPTNSALVPLLPSWSLFFPLFSFSTCVTLLRPLLVLSFQPVQRRCSKPCLSVRPFASPSLAC
jgi:hypothetical protein